MIPEIAENYAARLYKEEKTETEPKLGIKREQLMLTLFQSHSTYGQYYKYRLQISARCTSVEKFVSINLTIYESAPLNAAYCFAWTEINGKRYL